MIRRFLVAVSASAFLATVPQLATAASMALHVPKPLPDCFAVGSNCLANQTCVNRGGSCAVGGTNGEDGYRDPNGDLCGCQL